MSSPKCQAALLRRADTVEESTCGLVELGMPFVAALKLYGVEGDGVRLEEVAVGPQLVRRVPRVSASAAE